MYSVLSFIGLFTVKFIDQILRTTYLITIKKAKKVQSTVIIGIHQLVHISILIYIVNDYSIPNIIALVTSTMLGTYIVNDKFNQGSEKNEKTNS